MRLIFAGTPEFSATILRALLDQSHPLVAVYTQPDRPAGRGRRTAPCAVKSLAVDRGLALEQPHSLRDADAQQTLAGYAADLMIVAAYGLLLPKAVLGTPRLGCVNVHASLLPRWRGASPIQAAILAGDRDTGISIMQMDPGLDTGPVLCRAACPIRDDDTGASLEQRLAVLGAETLLASLSGILTESLSAEPQVEADASYAGRISKRDGLLDWSRPAGFLQRQVRAFNPWPVAYALLPAAAGLADEAHEAARRLRIWSATVAGYAGDAPPGTVLASGAAGIDVATGSQALRILTLQAPGRRPTSSGDYLNAHALPAGLLLQGAAGA